ncbi:hypothetical protein KI387_037988, partial [Taxus chinensis]
MQHIQVIDISGNKLSGAIPGDIGSCVELRSLNLANNKLEGIVPKSIGQLKNLEDIDLSFNNLSGPVPPSIANLTMLRRLNFSYNNFNGSVSNQGAFRNLSTTSFMGNQRLCTTDSGRFNLPNCINSAKIRSHSNGFNRKVFIVAFIPTFLALCWILGAVYAFYRKTQMVRFTNSLLRVGFMQISSEELHRATEGFGPGNLLGAGSFGSVYRGLLSDNMVVAVKVFDHDPQNSYKNFYRECRILSKIRHRNLVKVLSSCSTVDFRALVLEFMSQGSLEKHLHEDETQCRLNLKMRVNIALDVAHGMAYLHHDSSPPVVHCDLKPSNVLMDESMTAHVADFGIARLMTSSDSGSSSTSRLKGTIGYIAPEYGMGGEVTRKGDVYSFGMLILEMVTRKRPTDDMFTGRNTLPSWVRRAFPEAVKEVVDRELLVEEIGAAESRTAGEFDSTEHGTLITLIGVGLQCTRQNPGERPTMREVEGMLEKTMHGTAYGNLEEHASLPSLVATRHNTRAT